jgi:hypothetical protein
MTGTIAEVPDYFLINIKDVDVLNFMIEKQFFKASHEVDNARIPDVAKIILIKHDLDD